MALTFVADGSTTALRSCFCAAAEVCGGRGPVGW
jgi:hypothetical protein